MRQLSAAGQQLISSIAQRHGFTANGRLSLLDAEINGNGSMAQFSHPDFSGSGQWMRGGMTLVSDMFNNHLKGRVDGLCSDLPKLVANQQDLVRSGCFQSQSPPMASAAPAYQAPLNHPAPGSAPAFSPAPTAQGGCDADIFGSIERLADLRAKGVLNDDECSARKAELLR